MGKRRKHKTPHRTPQKPETGPTPEELAELKAEKARLAKIQGEHFLIGSVAAVTSFITTIIPAITQQNPKYLNIATLGAIAGVTTATLTSTLFTEKSKGKVTSVLLSTMMGVASAVIFADKINEYPLKK